MSNWELAARIVGEDCDVEVDMNEEYFICPECEEPIFADDWSGEDFMEDDCIVCPICKALIADHYRVDEFMRYYPY